MHVLFVHRTFPAQFGPIADRLSHRRGYRCTFVSEMPAGRSGPIRRLRSRSVRSRPAGPHDIVWPFVEAMRRARAVLATLKAHPRIRPDVVVGHSGFGSTVFLRELYDCPIVNHFEYYYHPRNSDMDFRSEFPVTEADVLRLRARNAVMLLDLANCTAGYAPTRWQRSLFPREYRRKIDVIFDGIDTSLWRRRRIPRRIRGRSIPPTTRIVTYVARGFESIRGFDIFMKVAQGIADAREDVLFVCVGSDRIYYGGDRRHIRAPSFRAHVLGRGRYDLDRFMFTGLVSPRELADLFSLSDLHIYLTVPFVLSWSLVQALACGCTVLASDTPPVREVIQHGRTGLLAGFHDVDRLAALALDVLDDPQGYRPLGQAGVALVHERYAVEHSVERLVKLVERVTSPD